MNKSERKWDPERLSQEFLVTAENAERYLNEVRHKLHQTKSYEFIFDETLAKFYVFNYLHGRTFLETRESLLAELRTFHDLEAPKPPEVFDFQRFMTFRKNIIEGLIRRLEDENGENTEKAAGHVR
jgi:hypothetical protein